MAARPVTLFISLIAECQFSDCTLLAPRSASAAPSVELASACN